MKERGNKTLRFFDRYMGIFLLFLLKLFKHRRKMPKEISSIALYKSAGIGDTVLLTAIIEDLKEAYPKAKIILFTGTSNMEMGRMVEGVQLIALPITKPWLSIAMIREKRADLFMDFDLWPRISALFSFFSGAKYTLGHKTENQYRHFLYDYAAVHSHHCHQLENYRKLLLPLGITPSHLPQVNVKTSEEKKRAVVLHLFSWGSKAKLKEWPEEKWNELIDFLLEKSVTVILTGSNEQKERLEAVCQRREGVENRAGMLSLEETAKLLKQSLGLVTIDTGIMHLAAALHIPVIALHGPTSEKCWGAIGPYVECIAPSINCHPCISLGFDTDCVHNRCMELISVEQVKRRVAKIL